MSVFIMSELWSYGKFCLKWLSNNKGLSELKNLGGQRAKMNWFGVKCQMILSSVRLFRPDVKLCNPNV